MKRTWLSLAAGVVVVALLVWGWRTMARAFVDRDEARDEAKLLLSYADSLRKERDAARRESAKDQEIRDHAIAAANLEATGRAQALVQLSASRDTTDSLARALEAAGLGTGDLYKPVYLRRTAELDLSQTALAKATSEIGKLRTADSASARAIARLNAQADTDSIRIGRLERSLANVTRSYKLFGFLPLPHVSAAYSLTLDRRELVETGRLRVIDGPSVSIGWTIYP